jgi:glutathione S-transferase
MAEYQLYCFAQSGNAYRAALMLNLIGADWEPVWVDFFAKGEQRTPDYRSNVNEMGEVPVLVHGSKKLSQSGVILTYLAERSGKFRPEGEDERLEALRWIIFDNQKVNGYLGPYRFLRYLARPPGDPAVIAFLKGRIDNNLAILDNRLSTASFMLGGRPSTSRRSTRTSRPGSSASKRCPAGSIHMTSCRDIRCRGGNRQRAVSPPSMANSAPVTKRDSSESR